MNECVFFLREGGECECSSLLKELKVHRGEIVFVANSISTLGSLPQSTPAPTLTTIKSHHQKDSDGCRWSSIDNLDDDEGGGVGGDGNFTDKDITITITPVLSDRDIRDRVARSSQYLREAYGDGWFVVVKFEAFERGKRAGTGGGGGCGVGGKVQRGAWRVSIGDVGLVPHAFLLPHK